ncbi:hypothetical protein SAMD00019534_047590 [Acytostelium subglobosum LB1]|uniref:hypothetical protein n=1 Tax=Acytostelium subglobosum LB1 TaxID=1410327 RepID=UPI0006451BB9|nr:hypothetical protein SAMD00019534_047590 [Acytostelium subglobosum LB1]GAM21584.1 hypothetical protein SAMD00019534_047590 [Acytostelium subglobosum LB1]|eukprot:XP_012755703.1 hypothetical protein SAMD00019534_047590 [Acytostelium subglobosum LB1]
MKKSTNQYQAVPSKGRPYRTNPPANRPERTTNSPAGAFYETSPTNSQQSTSEAALLTNPQWEITPLRPPSFWGTHQQMTLKNRSEELIRGRIVDHQDLVQYIKNRGLKSVILEDNMKELADIYKLSVQYTGTQMSLKGLKPSEMYLTIRIIN